LIDSALQRPSASQYAKRAAHPIGGEASDVRPELGVEKLNLLYEAFGIFTNMDQQLTCDRDLHTG